MPLSRQGRGDRRYISIHPDASEDDPYVDLLSSESAFEFATTHVFTTKEALPDTYSRTVDPEELSKWLESKKDDPGTLSADDNVKSPSLHKPIRQDFEIRVLEIQPGNRNDDLRGTLRHCSIELKYQPDNASMKTRMRHALTLGPAPTPVWYSALSYTWGPNVFDCRINCDGHAKFITKSLDSAIRHFRQTDKPVVMWIDQICINQDDLDEKVGQIRLMSRIYTHAFNTIIWLGEGAANTREGMDLLRAFKHYFPALPPADQLKVLDLPSLGSAPWDGLWDLLARPWFTRLWTAQEAALSKHRWIMCGEHILNWDELTAFTCRLEESDIQPLLLQMHAAEGQDTRFFGRYHASWMLEELSMRSQSGPGSKFNILTSVRHTLSYDPRDKIYGVLGTMPPEEAAQITVSYDADYAVGHVFEQVAAIDMGDEMIRIARVLACVDHDPELTHPSLPSWVPDWSQRRESASLGFNVTLAHVYNASGTRPPGTAHRTTYRYDGRAREIHVRIRRLGTIAQFSDVFVENPIPSNPLKIEANKGIHALMNTARDLSPNPYGEDIFEALWQTMVAARHDQGRLAGYRDEFAEIFSLIFDEAAGGSPAEPSLPGQTYTARQKRPAGRGRLELSSLLERKPKETYQLVRAAADAAMKNRRLAVLDTGFMALVPRYSRLGDWVCLFEGTFFIVPMVVRPREGTKFTFLGESYVHGVMNGEFAQRKDMPWQPVELV